MQIDILSLFPEMFTALDYSLIGKAQEKDLLKIDVTNFRDFTKNKHHSVDDTPYGGGAGMLLLMLMQNTVKLIVLLFLIQPAANLIINMQLNWPRVNI